MLVTCKDYGYTAPGQIGLASLGPYDSPPPGHVNSMVAMYIKTNDAATINLRFAAQHFARLAASLTAKANAADAVRLTQPGMLSGDMRDIVVESCDLITNACIVGDGMTGAMRVPDAVTALMTSRKNPAKSNLGQEVAQPLLQELDAVLEGRAEDLSRLGMALDTYWSRIKEAGLLLSLSKVHGASAQKISGQHMGVLAALREQLFMALANAPMQAMRRTSLQQYALPDCLEAIVRMHNLGSQRALELADELGCGCLFPHSLQQDAGRQLSGGGSTSILNVKTLIKEDLTTADAVQAHGNIVRKLPPPFKPKKRAVSKEEARELAHHKVDAMEKSRPISSEGVIFVRSGIKRGQSQADAKDSPHISLHMFEPSHQRLEKDPISTAVGSVFAEPIHLAEPEFREKRPKPDPRDKREQSTSEQRPISEELWGLDPSEEFGMGASFAGVLPGMDFTSLYFGEEATRCDFDIADAAAAAAAAEYMQQLPSTNIANFLGGAL